MEVLHVTNNNIGYCHSLLVTERAYSVDTETTGLKEHDKAFMITAANDNFAMSIDSRDISPLDFNVLMTSIGRNHGSTRVFQNAKFDMRMLPYCHLNFLHIEDTAVLGRLVNNDFMSYSLKDAAKRRGMEKSPIVETYIKEHKLHTHVPYKYKEGLEKLLHFDRVPKDVISEYAVQDAVITWKLRQALLKDLDPISKPVWEMEKALTPVCFAMERKGVKINIEYTMEAMKYEQGIIERTKKEFLLASGVHYDNKKTTLCEVFKKAGETIPLTDKGNDSLTDDVLESFTSPIAKMVQKVRHFEKRISTYYTNFLELADSNGVIHPDMFQSGTTTGRFSYRDPNFQNVPKEEDSTEPYVVRGCIMPRPGNILLQLDYKQQEYRLMLAYAKHTKLIEQVMGGADVHQATADMVGIKRGYAKTLNFAILYGAGPPKIAGMLGVTVQEATALRNKYFDALIEVEDLIVRVTTKGRQAGHVYNWLGRKLQMHDSQFAYKFPNWLIQGGGADICKLAMTRLAGEPMILQIHDALIFELPMAEAQEKVEYYKRVMIEAFPPKNGMAMDVDVTWSDTSLAERDMKPWVQKL